MKKTINIIQNSPFFWNHFVRNMLYFLKYTYYNWFMYVLIERKGRKVAEKKRKRRRRKRRRKSTGVYKKVLKIAGIVVIVLVVAYLAVGFYFRGRFNPGTKLNGLSVSGKTASEAEKLIQNSLDEYVLQVTDRSGKTEQIRGTDISLQYVSDGTVLAALKKQNSFTWPKSLLFGSNEKMEYSLEYDDEALKEVVSGFSCMNTEEEEDPKNAYPEYQDGTFTIVPEEYGSKVDEDKFNKVLADKLNSLNDTLNMEEEKCYVAPEYTADSTEVVEACDKLNSYLNAQITYKMHNDDTVEVSKDELAGMLSYSSKMKAQVKKKKVKEYIQTLKDKYDTAGETIKFKTGSGRTVKVSGGDFGWCIDLETEADQLIKDIKSGGQTEREPEYSQTGDIGDTYAEVDLTNQHMYYTKNGKVILDCDVVTGNVSAGNGTPAGIFSVTYTQRDKTLRGPKQSDGSYKWESFVSYWMPFNGGIGFHDATWRSSFGGTIYKTNGSHGCVNMPPAKAKELFGYLEAGTPVIVYN